MRSAVRRYTGQEPPAVARTSGAARSRHSLDGQVAEIVSSCVGADDEGPPLPLARLMTSLLAGFTDAMT